MCRVVEMKDQTNLLASMSPDTGMFCVFTSSREEEIASSLRTLLIAVTLVFLTKNFAGVPLLGVRKSCLCFGTKSGSRKAFYHTDIPHPQGTRLCFSKSELAKEIALMWRYMESKYKQLFNELDEVSALSKFKIKLALSVNDVA